MQIAGKQGATFMIFYMSSSKLSPEEFGLMSYLMAVVSLIMIFSDFGISAATTKYVAEAKSKSSSDIKKIIPSSFLIVILLGITASLFVIIAGKFIWGENYKYILLLIPYIFLLPLTSVLDGIYRGLSKFRKLSVITFITGSISVIIAYVLIDRYGFTGVIFAQNLFYLNLFIGLVLILEEKSWRPSKEILVKVLKYSLVIGFSSIFYYLYSKVDFLILKEFGYTVEIAYYEILDKILITVIIPFTLLGQVLAPGITGNFANKNYLHVKQKFRFHTLLAFGTGVFLSIVMVVLLPVFLEFFFPKYYTEDMIYMLRVLLLLVPIRAAASLNTQAHIVSTGSAKYLLWVLIPAGVMNVILDFYFIERNGFVGVIYSTLICYSFAIISLHILYNLKLNRLTKK